MCRGRRRNAFGDLQCPGYQWMLRRHFQEQVCKTRLEESARALRVGLAGHLSSIARWRKSVPSVGQCFVRQYLGRMQQTSVASSFHAQVEVSHVELSALVTSASNCKYEKVSMLGPCYFGLRDVTDVDALHTIRIPAPHISTVRVSTV